jgi:molybdenum cofactor cytidylyltransferase
MTPEANDAKQMTMNEIWAIVLAAGKSERMGSPKMLLPFGESTIIETVIGSIRNAGLENILVVLGAYRQEIENAIRKIPAETCYNPEYSAGMHTSVICGFGQIPEQAGAALLFLGDQPSIPPEVIKEVISAWETSGKGIVIPTFNGKRGHPTLFDLRLKKEILQLDPLTGLRSLMTKFPGEIREQEMNFPQVLRDIDTKIDYLFELNLISEKWKKK